MAAAGRAGAEERARAPPTAARGCARGERGRGRGRACACVRVCGGVCARVRACATVRGRGGAHAAAMACRAAVAMGAPAFAKPGTRKKEGEGQLRAINK